MNRQIFFLDNDGSGGIILTLKKDKVFIATQDEELECLEPEKLLTAIFWEMLDEKIILVGQV